MQKENVTAWQGTAFSHTNTHHLLNQQESLQLYPLKGLKNPLEGVIRNRRTWIYNVPSGPAKNIHQR